RNDQPRAHRDVARPARVVALRRGVRIHGDARAGRQPLRRRRARRLRPACQRLARTRIPQPPGPRCRARGRQGRRVMQRDLLPATASRLDIRDLHVALDAEAGIVRAIDGLSLSIQRGETFALVGESGCGKSMTALALMRLLPDNGRITSGKLEVDGEDVFALPESQMREVRGGKIGMIFQEPSTSLNPVMRVGDQIVEAIETHTELRGEAARAKAVEWLRRVGIPEPERRIDDYPFRMSGGQKQRVMIAMTLASEPDYLVADE